MAVLAAATPAGATKLTLGGPTSPSPYVVVGKNLLEAELCRVVSTVGKTVTLASPLVSAKPAKCIVQPFDGGVAPAAWFGLRMTNAEADASVNTKVLNDLSQSIYKLGVVNGLPGIRIDGQFYIDDAIKLERDQILEGGSPTTTVIRAAASFAFTDEEKAVIVGYRDGQKVSYANPGPTARYYLRNFQINCHARPNSNGILMSVQQPQVWDNVRVDEAAGYGISLCDTLDAKMNAVTLIGNGCALRLRSASEVHVTGLNIEQNKGPSCVIAENGSKQLWFDGVHMETAGLELNAFDLRDSTTSFSCRDFYYTNPQTGTAFRFDTPQANPGGACRYVLSNVLCKSPSNTYKMVDDIQRGKSLNSLSDTDRWIDYLTPRVLVAGYTKTP